MKKFIWIVPEKCDEEFSVKLFERFESLAASLGSNDFVFEIIEKYDDEAEPHYHIKAGTDNCSDEFSNKSAVNTWYSAITKEQSRNGVIKVILQTNKITTYHWILNSGLFVFYDEYIREDYPEWQTNYNEIYDPSLASC